jgi:hypothetical protein
MSIKPLTHSFVKPAVADAREQRIRDRWPPDPFSALHLPPDKLLAFNQITARSAGFTVSSACSQSARLLSDLEADAGIQIRRRCRERIFGAMVNDLDQNQPWKEGKNGQAIARQEC